MEKIETLQRIKNKIIKNKKTLNEMREAIKRNKPCFLTDEENNVWLSLIRKTNEIIQNNDWILSNLSFNHSSCQIIDGDIVEVEEKTEPEEETFGITEDDYEDGIFEENTHELYKGYERAVQKATEELEEDKNFIANTENLDLATTYKNHIEQEESKKQMLPVVKNEIVPIEETSEQNFIMIPEDVYGKDYKKWAKTVENKHKLIWKNVGDAKIIEDFDKLYLYKFFEWHPDGFYMMRFYSKKYTPDLENNESKGDFGCITFYKDGHIEYYLEKDNEEYKPKKFLLKSEIKNREDKDIQLQMLERLNWLIDNNIIEVKNKKKTVKKNKK